MTDYVDDRTGKITHIDDEKDQVIATTTTVINRMQELANQGDRSAYNTTLGALESNDVTNLHMTRHEFMSRASTTYAESSFPWSSGDELANEMNAIAWVNTRNGEAYGARSPDAQRYNNTAFGNQDDKMKLANLAIVNQLRGGPDPSNGAGFWDGMEQAQFPDSNKSRSVKVTTSDGRRQSWELHKNTIGWSISDEHYAKWKKNIGGSFRAPQVSKTAAGKIGYHSTAVWGRTIFWRK